MHHHPAKVIFVANSYSMLQVSVLRNNTAEVKRKLAKKHFSQPELVDEIIKLDDDELKVLLTPGHSPGSVCYYCEAQKFVIGGDVLFRMSIGRSDLPGGDFRTLIQSILEKLFTLPDDVKVYSGHGEPTTIGFEKMNNPFLK